jgi:signal transduction histidine kinase/ligand-binding sensor domain-containing protein
MKKLIWVVLLLLSVKGLRAQQQSSDNFQDFDPRFEAISLPGGSIGNSVQQIVQDSAGFLWFASQAGLIRYDGRNFVTYHFDPNNPNTPSSDYIESIFIDSKGMIWLTHWQEGGLTSFDPDSEIFTRYKHDPNDPESLSGTDFSVVTEDRSGYIWIGGQSGLDRLDRKTGKVKRFHHDPANSQSLSCDTVRALYVDRQGTLWIGTGWPWNNNDPEQRSGGLNRYDPKTETFTRFMHDSSDPNSISNNIVRTFLEDSKGNFWVGTAGIGLQRMDRSSGKFESYAYDPANPGKMSRPYLRGTGPANAPSNSHVTSMIEDHYGRFWIAAYGSGLNVYDPASATERHFEIGNNTGHLPSNFIWNLSQTRDGTIWATTGNDSKIVFKVRDKDDLIPFFESKSSTDDTTSFAHSIITDHSGNIWMDQNPPVRLKRINRQTGKVDVIPLGLPSDSITIVIDMLADSKGNLWLGTNGGLFTGKPERADFHLFRSKNNPKEIPGLTLKIFETTNGKLWFAGFDSGLSEFDPGTGAFTNFQNDPKNPNSINANRVMGLYEDAEGNLWVGGGSPWNNPDMPLFLDRFNQKTRTFDHFVNGPGRLGLAFNITADNAGNIWFIDFNGGLFKLNPLTRELKKFTQYNSLLPGGQLLSMVKARDGNLWIGCDRSIIRFDPETEAMTVFDASHGVKNADGHFNSGRMTSGGELLFARKGGYHAFYPEQLFRKDKDNFPDIRITGFRLLDERIKTGSNSDSRGILKKPAWQTSNIRLTHDQNVFSFSIACFDYYNPGATQLQFMLEGYDKGWRKDIRDSETPSYINIPPGQYTFRVRGANSFGVWNLEGIRLGITILPPWYKSWWAYIGYGLIVLTGIFLFDRFMRQRIIHRERRIRIERELEQAKEIEKAYAGLKAAQEQLIQTEKMASLGELTAGIAHEIQNPLNFVNNFSELNAELIADLKQGLEKGKLEEVKIIADNIKTNEEKIGFHGKRADAIVKSMLLHSRTNTGRKEPTDINALCDEYLRLSFHGLRAKDKTFNAKFESDLDPGLPKINVIPQEIGRVILNLINNAFYAVNERKKLEAVDYVPTVSVSTRKIGEMIEIRVKDNGTGIPGRVKDKIFQPFFTTKPSGQGTGLGLSLSYDIITQGHGGTIQVEPGTAGENAATGTSFIIHLPV